MPFNWNKNSRSSGSSRDDSDFNSKGRDSSRDIFDDELFGGPDAARPSRGSSRSNSARKTSSNRSSLSRRRDSSSRRESDAADRDSTGRKPSTRRASSGRSFSRGRSSPQDLDTPKLRRSTFSEATRLKRSSLHETPEQRELRERLRTQSSRRQSSRRDREEYALSSPDRIQEAAFKEQETRRRSERMAVSGERISESRRSRDEIRRAQRNKPSPFTQTKQLERRSRQRVRLIQQIAALSAFIIVLVLLVWGGVRLANSPVFYSNEIVVEGLSSIEETTVRELASIDTSASTLFLKKKDVQERVAKHPWISNVEVKKNLPHTVNIIVSERKPGAVVNIPEEGEWLLSQDSRWLGSVDTTASQIILVETDYKPILLDVTSLVRIADVPKAGHKTGAPLKSDEIANALKIILGISKELRDQTEIISALSIPKTKLFTKNGIEIAIGSAKEITEKDKIAREIMRKEEGKVVLINVRTITKPTWRGLSSE